MNYTNIYILIDPTTNQIRYVGKANNIKERLQNHKNRCRDANTYKRHWINKLRLKGLYPELEVIDIVPISEWKYWEKFWISYYKSIGCKLTNTTSGGDGLNCGNKTSFKRGQIPWNKGTAKPIIKKGFNIKCLDTSFKKGSISWNKGLKGVKLKPNKNIHQYSALTGKFIKTWNTAKEASTHLIINEEGIGQCARGNAKTSGGYIWSYIKIEKVKPINYTGKTNNKLKTKLK